MSTAVAPASAAAATQVPTATSSASPTIVLSKAENASSEKKAPSSATPKKTSRLLTTAESKEDQTEQQTDPLPADLRRILTEVAHTGKCPWLSWNGKDAPEAPMPPDMLPNKTSRSSLFQKSRPASSAFSSFSSPARAPVRKKYRNGVHVNRRRFATENGSSSTTTATGTATTTSGRKRPLYLTRTPSATSSAFSVSSIGSGRTSGSEVEDSTQYECDSEGTSATTNSELSVERRRRVTVPKSPAVRYKTLQEAVRTALGLVLDHSYRYRGGYKLSPAEIRIHAAAAAAQNSCNDVKMDETNKDGGEENAGEQKKCSVETEVQPPRPEKIYQQRRRRLLAMLGGGDAKLPSESTSPLHHSLSGPSYLGDNAAVLEGPPFTIQRIAEVLVFPEKYYKQTHKLCNCLEKLLLITAPASAFGGSVGGGGQSQEREEETEYAGMAGKKGHQESEHRSRRLRRRVSSLSDDENAHKPPAQNIALLKDEQTDGTSAKKPPATDDNSEVKKAGGASHKPQHEGGSKEDESHTTSREELEAAARASLRTKFDHVGIDPHSPTAVDRSVPRIAGANRGMTSSPPPPSLALGSAAQAMALSPTRAHGFGRQLGEQPPTGVGESASESVPHHPTRNPLPFFSATNESGTPIQALHANHGIHMLQMHHAAALAGVPLNNTPVEFVIDPTASGTPASAPAAASTDVGDLEVEPGRSSASNSDVDSESDVSLDDSASDRSDGSDSGGHYEPFTAARVMALNRMQQQQRMQNRGQPGTILGSHYQHGGEGFRPPADAEYQSGDSIDSTLAEDSCGSDSSSSDMAD